MRIPSGSSSHPVWYWLRYTTCSFVRSSTTARNFSVTTPADPGRGLCFGCVPALKYSSMFRSGTRRKLRPQPGVAGGVLEISSSKTSWLEVVVSALLLGCSGTDLSAPGGPSLSLLGSTGGQSDGGASDVTTSSASAGGANGAGGSGSTVGGTLSVGTGGTTGDAAPTWTQLYNAYFGPGTAGDCVSCHASETSPTFNSAATLCTALKATGYIGNGTATLQSLLTWFGGSGSMPLTGGTPPANATKDILAWQNASAVCP